MKDKTKHQIKKHLSESQTTNTDENTSFHVDSTCDNRKKKKRKVKFEETPESSLQEDDKQKKKIKSKDVIVSDNNDVEASVGDINSNASDKKQLKKRKAKSEDVQESLMQKKKKDKKEKQIDPSVNDNVSGSDKSSEVISTETVEGKKSKKKKKDTLAQEETSLGLVDTSILKQATINLGLPMADNESTVADTPVVKDKKKKKKKNKGQTPSVTSNDKTKNEKTVHYLRLWYSKRKEWKFNKMLQVHLLHLIYDKSVLSDEDFETLLLYLEGMKGKSRDQTKEVAEKIINSDKEADSIDSYKEERARRIMQILS